ncbi:MAG: uracil-DNA glycosylase [Planctomycetota bacterium]|nr:uracil-DNA glycosylase [Planctomycetota bacterium]
MELRIAQLHLDTSKLMGVNFIPVGKIPANKNKQLELNKLCDDHDAMCPHCTNAAGHTNTVFGTGDPDASVMFIGEAPGMEEDLQGVPFVGAAGKKLNQIIEAMGLCRSDVYIANILKSRPPENRTPTQDEITSCGPYLKSQIDIVAPSVIVTLGSPATKYILDTTAGIMKMRGVWGAYEGIPVMPTFHPAYLLRNYTTETRTQVWSDMKQVVEHLSL